VTAGLAIDSAEVPVPVETAAAEVSGACGGGDGGWMTTAATATVDGTGGSAAVPPAAAAAVDLLAGAQRPHSLQRQPGHRPSEGAGSHHPACVYVC